MDRRFFLKQSAKLGASIALSTSSFASAVAPDSFACTILHTNDLHSRIDPFPQGDRNGGKGGASSRFKLINKIRSQEEHVLLFDSGDIIQGTPYFNFFSGEVEFKLMEMMKYDAVTLGNHDFDAGLDSLSTNLSLVSFPVVSSNYDFSNTPLQGQTKPFEVFEFGRIRIGVFGLGIKLDGLVPDSLVGETRYEDPVETANRIAKHLSKEEKCDYVICLSHLGYRYSYDKIDDRKLASLTKNINLILGGHTHTFLLHPEVISDLDGQPVMINQAGWGGIQLGRIDLRLEAARKGKCTTCENLWIS